MLRSVTGLHLYYYFGHLCDYQLAKTIRDKRPEIASPALLLLLEQGRNNETAYVKSLQEKFEVLSLQEGTMEERAERTLEAMQRGVEVLHNGVLDGGAASKQLAERYAAQGHELRFRGETDLLFRVERPSLFGDWSYVVADVKSSRTSRLPQMMQVAYYDWLLESVQGGSTGEGQIIVFPDGCNGAPRVDPFALDDLRPSLELFLSERLRDALGAPEPLRNVSAGCSKCLWSDHCRSALEASDDLLRIAGIRPGQKRVLLDCGIASPRQLAGADIEEVIRSAGASEGLRRVARKARAMTSGRPILKTPVDDVVRDWLVENDSAAPSPLKQGPLLVFIDVAADPLADTTFAFGVKVAGNASQAFCSEGVGDEDLTFSRFLQGMERVGRRAGGHFAVLHFGGATAARLRRLREKHPPAQAGGLDAVLDNLLHRMVDVRALLRRAYDFPDRLHDLHGAARYLGDRPEEFSFDALGWEPPLIEEARSELEHAAERIGVKPESLHEGEDAPLVWWRMHLETRHRLWTGLIELAMRQRVDDVAGLWEAFQRGEFVQGEVQGV